MSATIGIRMSLTLQIGDREFFRPEMSIEGIDPSLPLKPQLEAATKALGETFNETSKLLLDKVGEYLKAKSG